MTTMVMLCLAGACWCWPERRWVLYRVVDMPVRNREPRWLGAATRPDDPFAVAATLDLLAVCLRAGLPVAVSVRVAAQSAPTGVARPLAAAAELLSLGADPQQAWAPASTSRPDRRWWRRRRNGSAVTCFDELATLARRSARAGSALSQGVTDLAGTVRRRANDDALARAERAGVMISGPLGLCFLPAFVCLGIVPVVVGLAAQTLGGI